MAKPLSTYRLQFREGMTFRKAEGLIPYLKALGISHLYASPIFAATEGSTHGYDVTDPGRIDPVLGGKEGFVSLARALRQEGLGLLLDIVPNHMAASLENPWWRNVIEWGHASRHARCFDIDWEQPLTLPFLGARFSDIVEKGEIRLKADREQGLIALAYFDQAYPLNPGTYSMLFREMKGEPAETITLLSKQASAEAEEIFHGAMRALMAGPGAGDLDRHLERLSADPNFLRQLHDLQNYRLMDWREAPKGLSYRRFFEIAGLVGLRVEDPDVFEKVHACVFELVDEGLVDGLRIDHIDGLADPKSYLSRLRGRIGPDTYLVVEKILGPDEHLPADWPVEGTTGYEFITALGSLLAHGPGVERLEAAYRRLSPSAQGGEAGIADAKQLMMRVNFSGEMRALARKARALLARDAENPPSEDVIRETLEDILTAFPVYRTYGTQDGMPAEGGALLDRILSAMPEGRKAIASAIVDLLKSSAPGEMLADFRIRFQQLSGPLMAKSLEDTFFYRHHAFIAFNEVGGEAWSPERPWPDFHETMIGRREREPLTMNATATHDTKRGEDARARLLALSEDPDRWIEGVARWRSHLVRLKPRSAGPAVEPEMEWLVFQALAGIWPVDFSEVTEEKLSALSTRLQAFLEKAAREAKLASNWNAVNGPYEETLKALAASLLSPAGEEFRRDFGETLKPYVRAGHLNSLTQTILKLTAPGVHDIYQGSERADFSLVDPDNRRAQDFERLRASLRGEGDCEALDLDDATLADGRLKQWLIARLLNLRQHYPALFLQGSYQPLAIEGENRGHLLSFLRRHEGRSLIVAVPLKTLCLERGERIDPGEGRTRIVLPEDLLESRFEDVLTGHSVRFPERDTRVSAFAAAGYSLLFNPGS